MKIRIIYSSLVLFLVVACIPVPKKNLQKSVAQKNDARTPCCLCILKDGENEVGHLSEEACNTRFKTGSYKRCSIVEIKEKTCDFFSISEGECKKRNLTYYENDQPKKLSPPSFIPEICKPRQNATAPEIEWEEEQGEDGNLYITPEEEGPNPL